MGRSTSIIGLMAVYNEADIVEQIIKHTIGQGLELVILDNGSQDGSSQLCREYLNRGVLEIERVETKSLDLIFNLRLLEEMTQKHSPDWLGIIDSDEIHESPYRSMTLRETIKHEESLGFNLIRSNNFNFWPTPLDNPNEIDPLKRIMYYTYTDDYHFPFWKNYQGIDCWSGGSHLIYFPQDIKPKLSPNKFAIRHYKIRSPEHGRRKALDNKARRFKYPPLPDGWMIHYDKFSENRSCFVKDANRLTRYDNDREWNLERRLNSGLDGWAPPPEDYIKNMIMSGVPLSHEAAEMLYTVGTRHPPDERVLRTILLEIYRKRHARYARLIRTILLKIRGKRPDLQEKSPPFGQDHMQRVIEWMVSRGLEKLHPAFKVLAPILTLRYVYDKRRDLQEAYPEVREDGEYKRLIKWAVKHEVSTDGSKSMLKPYLHWYVSYLHNPEKRHHSKLHVEGAEEQPVYSLG